MLYLHIHPCWVPRIPQCHRLWFWPHWKFSMKTSSAIYTIYILSRCMYYDLFFYLSDSLLNLKKKRSKWALIAYLCCWIITINLHSEWCLGLLLFSIFDFYIVALNLNYNSTDGGRVQISAFVFLSRKTLIYDEACRFPRDPSWIRSETLCRWAVALYFQIRPPSEPHFCRCSLQPQCFFMGGAVRLPHFCPHDVLFYIPAYVWLA